MADALHAREDRNVPRTPSLYARPDTADLDKPQHTFAVIPAKAGIQCLDRVSASGRR